VNEDFTIVGVVKDSRFSNPRSEIRPVIYMTFLQTNTGRGQMVLHARVAGSVAPVIQRLRQEVTALDPAMPMFDLHTLDEEMGAALVQQRLVAMLASLFGALALLLACVGLYGLLAFSLVQRTTELGIRLALGARRSDVVWLLVREALWLVAIGIAVGVPAALLLGRFASSQVAGLLFGLKPTDPFVIGSSVLILIAVAMLAAYLPARRAARVDPMLALRAE
jgi:predicted lysophospholipase L1 biosynthesis ABC-type transport system permease subunit